MCAQNHTSSSQVNAHAAAHAAIRGALHRNRRVPRAGALHGDAIAARAVSGGILNRIDRVWISCGSHPELSLILVG